MGDNKELDQFIRLQRELQIRDRQRDKLLKDQHNKMRKLFTGGSKTYNPKRIKERKELYEKYKLYKGLNNNI